MDGVRDLVRLGKFYLNQRIVGFDAPTEPHFDDPSTERFKTELGRSNSYLEFGAGGSTIFADRLAVPTITVESDRFYAKVVERSLRSETKVRLLTVDIGLTAHWGTPVFRTPTSARVACWRRYVEAPFDLLGHERAFPDFVLVDGRFRVACALQTARKAQQIGHAVTLMVDDYEGRSHYEELESYLGQPEHVGRAAFFRVEESVAPVPGEAVEQAMRDFR